MDRIERKHKLKAMLNALRLPDTEDAATYEALLAQMDIASNFDRDILRAALTDAVYDCRRQGEDESDYQRFIKWLDEDNLNQT